MLHRTTKRWLALDNETLKELATKRPAAEIAKLLGRTREATVVQASKLGISLRVRMNAAMPARSSGVAATRELESVRQEAGRSHND
jgi:hypothetical protein